MLSKKKSRKGMTLIEIVVVVSIIGVLLAIVGSSISGFIRPSAKSIADKLKASMQYAYRVAMVNNCTVGFDIDMEKNTYTAFKILRDENGLKEKKILEGKFPANNKVVDITDIRGIKFENSKFRIPFTHSGISGDYNIHIGEAGSIQKTVLVYRYGGKVLVKNGEVNRVAGQNKDSGTSSIKLNDKEEF
jgi:general secretion pathway protein H